MFETITEIKKILAEQAEAVEKVNGAMLNAAVYQARLAVIAAEKKVFDRPREFSTDKAWVFKNAKPEGEHLSAELSAKEKQAQYLTYEIDGGTRHKGDPGATRYDVPVGADAADTDEYGGIAYGTSKKYSKMYRKEKKARAVAAKRRAAARGSLSGGLTEVAKRRALAALKKWEWIVKSDNEPGIFFGSVDGVKGYYLRPQRSLADAVRHPGVHSVHPEGKPKLVMQFSEQARYKPLFPYDATVERVAKEFLSSEAFSKEMERIEAKEKEKAKAKKSEHSEHSEHGGHEE